MKDYLTRNFDNHRLVETEGEEEDQQLLELYLHGYKYNPTVLHKLFKLKSNDYHEYNI